MKKLYFFITTLLFSQMAMGQWTAIPQLISGTDTAANLYCFKGYGNVLFACTNKGLFSSTNDGDTWTNLTFTKAVVGNLPIRAVYTDGAGKIYAGSDSTVYISTNNGSSWSATGMPMVDRINDIEAVGDTIMVSWGSFTNGGIYYSVNNMTTATAATAPNLPMTDFQFDGTTIFVGGKNGAYKSTDNGLNWVLAGTGHPTGKYLFMTKSGNSLFGGDAFGDGLYKSTDHGGTWAKTDTSLLHGFCQVFSVTSANGMILITVDGATCNSGVPVKISADDGVTFTPYITGLPTSYFPVCGRNASGSCFFVWDANGKTVYRVCSGTAVREEIARNAKIMLAPNPTNDRLMVTLGKAVAKGDVRILNTTGQLVANVQLVSTAKTEMNVAALPAGIYFVQVSTGAEMFTAKFVKE